ncbi:MAG: phage portal protein [Gemmataceae bacterium]|nr:phage portal protein [Gemmataceae bacterium]
MPTTLAIPTYYSHGAPAARTRSAGSPRINARIDNALTTDENRRNWWQSDFMSAKAANNFAVRRTLRMRSRYEVANNPYLFGIVNSNADDLIGKGPTLQLQTGDAAYNRRVERAWADWCAEVELAEKLRTTKLAKTVDGEGFLVLKTVADLEHPVKLYPCDLEADQVTSPAPANMAELWVDGLVLHPVTGRPKAYTVLKYHPGDFWFPTLNPLEVDRIQARHVIHWFPKCRPGQVRGVPIFSPSLDLFAELRAFRKAVLANAQTAAALTVLLKQDPTVGAPAAADDDNEYAPFVRVPIERNAMTMLPPGVDAFGFDPKQPGTTYEMFQEKCLGEACRPLNYPLNLALGTSQKFNFSSAKLDHINYRTGLGVEREDCNAVALNKLFAAFHEEALLAGMYGPFEGLAPPPHEWHWPGFEPLDPVADAAADHDRLAQGTLTYREFWARRGYDWRDVFEQQRAERDEMGRLGIAFGEPVKRSVSETEDANGNPKEPANAA